MFSGKAVEGLKQVRNTPYGSESIAAAVPTITCFVFVFVFLEKNTQ
jgi:hypothetical protein